MNEQSQRSILFTNLFLGSYTGSELHVLRLATEFVKHGWRVCCYTLISSFPLLPVFESRGIKVVEFGNENDLDESYDVLYAQHHVVSNYLTSNFDTTFRYIVVSSLGTITNHEHLPEFASIADLVVFVSEECRDARYPELGETYAGSVLLFPNYADEEYFAAASQDASADALTDRPLRIAAITNHLAPEVSGLTNTAPDDVHIDYIGQNTASMEVTPHLLSTYDLVITIGRTVQCCMAQRIPVYCYDVFGGPGYLRPNELDAHLYANYSGRSCPTKRAAAELWDDICTGYVQSVQDLDALRTYALERFRFEDLFAKLLQAIEEGLQTNHEHRRAQDDTVAVPYLMLAKLMHGQLMREYGRAELRKVNSDGGYDCLRFLYKYKTWIDYELPTTFGTTCQRFDPASIPCVVHHTSNCLTATNALTSTTDSGCHTDTFIHIDPIYSVKKGFTHIHMMVEPKSLNQISLEAWQTRIKDSNTLQSLRAQSQDLALDVEQLEQELSAAQHEANRSAQQIATQCEQIKLLKKAAAADESRIQELQTTVDALHQAVDALHQNQKSLRWSASNCWRLLKKRIKHQ